MICIIIILLLIIAALVSKLKHAKSRDAKFDHWAEVEWHDGEVEDDPWWI